MGLKKDIGKGMLKGTAGIDPSDKYRNTHIAYCSGPDFPQMKLSAVYRSETGEPSALPEIEALVIYNGSQEYFVKKDDIARIKVCIALQAWFKFVMWFKDGKSVICTMTNPVSAGQGDQLGSQNPMIGLLEDWLGPMMYEDTAQYSVPLYVPSVQQQEFTEKTLPDAAEASICPDDAVETDGSAAAEDETNEDMTADLPCGDADPEETDELNDPITEAPSQIPLMPIIDDEKETVSWGHYTPDGASDEKPEEIIWKVLVKEDEKALIISQNALDYQPYNAEYANVTWESCTLRNWLNSTFLENAFTEEEQDWIVPTKIKNDERSRFGTNGGNDTEDRLFLLSTEEVDQYFSGNTEKRCGIADCTNEAEENPAVKHFSEGGAACWWWLRTPGLAGDRAAYVSHEGFVRDQGLLVSDIANGVRPAMWIRLSDMPIV